MTSAFDAAADATRLVTSTVQIQPTVTAADARVELQNAVSRTGLLADEGLLTGQLMTNNGTGRFQPAATRSAVFSVSAGQTVRFGVYFRVLTTGWFGRTVVASTTYDCS